MCFFLEGGRENKGQKKNPCHWGVYLHPSWGTKIHTESSQRATQNWLAKAEKCYRKESLRTASFGPDPWENRDRIENGLSKPGENQGKTKNQEDGQKKKAGSGPSYSRGPWGEEMTNNKAGTTVRRALNVRLGCFYGGKKQARHSTEVWALW